MSQVMGNVAEAIITPPLGTELLEPQGAPATGVHDDLYVRVLALRDDRAELFIVTMDLVGLDLELVASIAQSVESLSGISSQQVMLNTSHTHSSPVTVTWGPTRQPTRNRAWEADMVQTVARCVEQSRRDYAPVTLAAGRAEARIGHNRRLSTMDGTRMQNNPAGRVAPWVDVLRVDRTDGRTLAVLFSHAAHPVAVHTAGTQFSADYPGVAAAEVRCQFGGDVMAMFAQGCSGDINVEKVGGGFAESERIGQILGRAAVDAARCAKPLKAGPLRTAFRRIALPFEPLDPDVTAAILARARESCAAFESSNPNPRALADQRELLTWAQAMHDMARSRPSGLPFPIQVFAVGPELAIVGLPHDIFVEYQLYLQRRSPFPHTMVFGYTNGCADYIPTAEAFALGGYEVMGAPKRFLLPPLKAECERLIKGAAMELLRELHEEILSRTGVPREPAAR